MIKLHLFITTSTFIYHNNMIQFDSIHSSAARISATSARIDLFMDLFLDNLNVVAARPQNKHSSSFPRVGGGGGGGV